MTRAIVDTNVFVSYLLRPEATGVPGTIIAAAFAGEFHLLISEATIDELRRVCREKAYLAARIDSGSVESFINQLRLIAIILPEITAAIPGTTRDVGDDYLIAHTLIEHPDMLVSGDKDLLALERVGDIPIHSPAEFVDVLDAQRSIGRLSVRPEARRTAAHGEPGHGSPTWFPP